MKYLMRISLAALFVVSISSSDYYDSKMKQWKQPNSVEITARLWGDEFVHQMETSDGYIIAQSANGYFYYAMLNAEGEFTTSAFKVGIDQPPAQSRNLKRSYARLAKIQEEIERTNSTRKDRRKSIRVPNGLGKIMTGGIDTCKLAVLLIDFTPRTRDSLYDFT